jgi:putative MATE family efflux protein
MGHVVRMTATGSIGLIAIFAVDLMSLLYISWLGDPHLTAAVGFATQISFFLISVNIGLSIAVSALMARDLGAGNIARARRYCASGLMHTAVIALVTSLLAIPFRHDLLMLLGARGEALEVGAMFLAYTLPANVLAALGMSMSGALRSVGDARRSMYVTLWGAAITAALDPILIFGMGLGVEGAAIATVFSRVAFAAVGLWGVAWVHRLMARPRLADALADLRPLMAVALPAIATNLAAPVATSWAMHVFSAFGEQTIAALAIIDRLIPVAFGVLFALSGAVGPIIAQNWGAGLYPRIGRTLTDCFTLVAVYTIAMWLLLWVGSPLILRLFAAEGATADLIVFFCRVGAAQWLFLGCLFVANAAFNNLGYAFLSTVFNWGRATLGTIPFVTLGAQWGGPEGGLLGIVIGAAIFGVGSIIAAFVVVRRIGRREGAFVG